MAYYAQEKEMLTFSDYYAFFMQDYMNNSLHIADMYNFYKDSFIKVYL